MTNNSCDSRSLNRRRLLQAAVAGSATVALGQAAHVAAAPAPGKGFHFSRTPAYQSDAPISVLVPSFTSVGDGFMRDQAEAFTNETGIGVEIQFCPSRRPWIARRRWWRRRAARSMSSAPTTPRSASSAQAWCR